jgi:exodeoxyribonuclease-3
MKIVTWNVNSVRARLHLFTPWQIQLGADVILFQELKCQDNDFPFSFFEDLGFSCKVMGEKSYNGVGILSKYSIEDVTRGLPTFKSDPAARYIEAVINGNIRVASVYVPNGGLVVNAKEYLHKLEFLTHLKEHMIELNKNNEIVLVGGDYNITPDDLDVYNPKAWHERVCCTTEERMHFKELLAAGYDDLLKNALNRQATTAKARPFTWWDYRGNAFANNLGLRIDHFLGNSLARAAVNNVFVDTWPRKMLRPSDHAPVICDVMIGS